MHQLYIICTIIVLFDFARETGGLIEEKQLFPVVPWIGILRIKKEPWGRTIPIAGLILIAEKVTIANSYEVGDITSITLTTYAEFRSEEFLYNINLKKCVTHPEHRERTSNSISLIFLDPDPAHNFEWLPIAWPLQPFRLWSNVFLTGIPDRSNTLQHRITKMDYVDDTKCKNFYEKEGISFKEIWPTYPLCCAQARNATDTCIYEAGMALATNATNTWTLVGISTFSPGCSVPARFVEVFPYSEWVERYILEARNGLWGN